MIPTVPVTMTHSQSAVWSLAGLLSLALLAVIALVVLGRAAGLHHRLQQALLRRERPVPTVVDAALIFLPETLGMTRLVTVSLALVFALTAGLWLVGGAWLALLSAPVVFLVLL